MDGYSYDAAGNLLNDGVHTYKIRPPENRIISVDNGATTYTYDAIGQRVGKTTGSTSTGMIYTARGTSILYPTNHPGSTPQLQMYVAGMHFGSYIVNSTVTGTIFYYNHADWLGTERARTNVAGVACETMQSLPFGDNLVIQAVNGGCTDTTDVSPMHFTGKERDTESGLDNFGARYDASSMGRVAYTRPALHRSTPFGRSAAVKSLRLRTQQPCNPFRSHRSGRHTQM